MAERELLDELGKILRSKTHRDYVQSYAAGRERGLSEKFDALVRAELREA